MFQTSQGGILVPATDESSYSHSAWRNDAWQNNMTGMGNPYIDGSASNNFGILNNVALNQAQLDSMYRFDWLSRKICDEPAKDACRKFIKFEDKKIIDMLDDLNFKQKCRTAIRWSRLYGGAGIVVHTEGDDPLEPLDPSKVSKVVALDVWDRWHLSPVNYCQDIYSTDYMKPEIYQNAWGGQFHTSRVLKFYGSGLTYMQEREQMFWGGSVVESFLQAISNFQCTTAEAKYILSELNIGILKLPHLTQIQAGGPSNPAAAKIQNRVNAFNATKSNQRVAAIDKEEDFNFVSRGVTGLADLLDRFKEHVCGATGFPEIKLFTKTTAGIGASDWDQIALYDDIVEDIQSDQVKPATNTLIKCLTGGDTTEWSFEPLRSMNPAQKAEILHKTALAAKEAVEVTGMTPEETREFLNRSFSDWQLPVMLGGDDNGLE